MLMESEDANGGGKWLRSGIGVMGNLALGVVSSVSSGAEAGAVIGATSGLMSIAAEMFSRALSQNENRRVRNVATIAIEEFNLKIKEGWHPREDGFFGIDINTRYPEQRFSKGFFKLREENMKRVSFPIWLTYMFLSHLPILFRQAKQIE